MNLNKTLIIGRLSKDPELKKLSSGTSVTNFSVATNESYKNSNGEKVEKVEFHSVIVYGAVADNCAKYLKKGQLVYVEGKIATRTWDKDDGSKGYKTEIIANGVQFGPKPQNAPGQAQEPEPVIDADSGGIRKPSARTTAKETPPKAIGSIDYPTEEINPDDIPF